MQGPTPCMPWRTQNSVLRKSPAHSQESEHFEFLKRTTYAPLITNRNKIELQDHILPKFSSIDIILRCFLKKVCLREFGNQVPHPPGMESLRSQSYVNSIEIYASLVSETKQFEFTKVTLNQAFALKLKALNRSKHSL